MGVILESRLLVLQELVNDDVPDKLESMMPGWDAVQVASKIPVMLQETSSCLDSEGVAVTYELIAILDWDPEKLMVGTQALLSSTTISSRLPLKAD